MPKVGLSVHAKSLNLEKCSYYVKVLHNLEDFNSCFNNLCLHVGRVLSGHQLGKPTDVLRILLTYEGSFVFYNTPSIKYPLTLLLLAKMKCAALTKIAFSHFVSVLLPVKSPKLNIEQVATSNIPP